MPDFKHCRDERVLGGQVILKKAYLAHSDKDARIVVEVATDIGPSRAIYFKRDFATGDDLIAAMRSGLSEASLFALFASADSLAAKPVIFEMEEAFRLFALEKTIEKALVFIIDDRVNIGDLPEWLRRVMVRPVKAPKIISQEIVHQLSLLERDKLAELFVDRHDQVQQLEQQLFPLAGKVPPRIFSVFGLPGMGRRRLASEIAKTRLSLAKSRIFRVQTGDGLPEIGIQMAAFAEAISDDEIGLLLEKFRGLQPAELAADLTKHLDTLIRNGILPILHDEGGLLDDDGGVVGSFSVLLAQVSRSVNLYLGLTGKRLLRSLPDLDLPQVRVSVLTREDTERLVLATAPLLGVSLSPEQAQELSQKLYGHPPAVFFALDEIRNVGLPLFLRDEHKLVEWRADYFIETLQGDAKLTDSRRRLLKAFAFYGPLPIEIVESVFGAGRDEWVVDLRHLTESALLDPQGEDAYSLPDPIREAVGRITQELDLPHESFEDAISFYLRRHKNHELRLHLLRKLALASRLGKGDKVGVAFTSDLLVGAQEAYDRQDYERAIGLSADYLEMQKGSLARGFIDPSAFLGGLTLMAKAHIKLGEFDSAWESIADIRSISPRQADFMSGFLESRRGRWREAARHFEEALARGYGGVAVHREIAEAYFFLDRYEEAAKHIAEAHRIRPQNRFVADLEAKIATIRGDEGLARQRLQQLNLVDRQPYYFYRLSVVELHFGHKEAAYKAAVRSVTAGNWKIISHLEQLCKSQIVTNRLDEAAETLNRLECNPNSRLRVVPLRVEWEIAREAYEEALVTLENVQNKESFEFISLREAAIRGLLRTLPANDHRLQWLKEQHERLHEELKHIRPSYQDDRDVDDGEQ